MAHAVAPLVAPLHIMSGCSVGGEGGDDGAGGVGICQIFTIFAHEQI